MANQKLTIRVVFSVLPTGLTDEQLVAVITEGVLREAALRYDGGANTKFLSLAVVSGTATADIETVMSREALHLLIGDSVSHESLMRHGVLYHAEIASITIIDG